VSKEGVILYGANGYTGGLIIESALRLGLSPTLAGRRAEAVEPLSRTHKLPCRIFALDDVSRVAAEIAPFQALLLAAGPFSATSAPALEACLLAKTSYLDITGEVDVFESLFAGDRAAKDAGISVIPGVGFDVVPTDCLAARLAEALPGAERLELAFRGGKTSAGTTKTMIEGLPKGGRARVNGALVRVPLAWKSRTVPFPDRERTAMTIPWGDLSTAYRSTGIPNIETYMALSPASIAGAKRMRLLAPLMGLAPVQSYLKARAGRTVKGPDAEERKRERSYVWGRAVHADGRSVEGTLETLEGYALTAETSARAARRVLLGDVARGALTPSQAFGARFIEEIPTTVVRIGEVR
jgi:short subunit dehydrogenase-like uncharacterized protein